MTNSADPLNLPFLNQPEAPDTLTLLSIIREDISAGLTPLLTRQDEKAFVIVSVVDNGIFVDGLALSKAGEYRTLDFDVNSVREMWMLKQLQYAEQPANEKKAWLSVTFHVENDGFVAKTEYNYDKRVFSGPTTPEEWFVAPENIEGSDRVIWTDDQYAADLALFPRTAE